MSQFFVLLSQRSDTVLGRGVPVGIEVVIHVAP